MRALFLISVVGSIATAACSKAESPPSPVVAGGWFEADPELPLAPQLAAQAQIAHQAGKTPHAYLHAAWCPPCVEIEKTRTVDEKMKVAFSTTHIIAIDVDDIDGKQIEAAGMKAQVIPIFYRLDATGVPTGASIDGGSWGKNVPETMAPQLTAYFTR